MKEPAHGPLGRAADQVVADVVRSVAGRRLVSAALGEFAETPQPPGVEGLAYAKWGLAGCADRAAWPAELATAGQALPECRLVPVAYADWRRAAAPPPEAVLAFALEHCCAALLIDTWGKDGTHPARLAFPGRTSPPGPGLPDGRRPASAGRVTRPGPDPSIEGCRAGLVRRARRCLYRLPAGCGN